MVSSLGQMGSVALLESHQSVPALELVLKDTDIWVIFDMGIVEGLL